MLNDDIDDDETTDVEYVTTPRTDEEEPSEPKQQEQPEIQESAQEVKKPEIEKKDMAVDGTTKDLLNESFEAMISIHR